MLRMFRICSVHVQNVQNLFRIFSNVQNVQNLFRIFSNVQNAQNLFRIFSNVQNLLRICSEFSVMFRICSVMFRLCSEYLAQKLVCSEFLDFVGIVFHIKMKHNIDNYYIYYRVEGTC